MGIAREPMCKKHPRQYKNSCVPCEQEFRTKMQQAQLELPPEEETDAASDNTVATEDS